MPTVRSRALIIDAFDIAALLALCKLKLFRSAGQDNHRRLCGFSSFESLAVRMASCLIVGRDAPILSERLRLRSSEDTTSRRAIVLTVSPAAVFYRASGFVL
jgi:hypothetical protein